MHDPMTGGLLAVKAVRAEVSSARPDSPVVPERRRPRPTVATRARLARGLIALADRVQPTEPAGLACSAGTR